MRDRAVLERILLEERMSTDAGGPSVWAYLRDLATAAERAFTALVVSLLGQEAAVLVVAAVLVLVVAALVSVAVIRVVRTVRRHRGPPHHPVPIEPIAALDPGRYRVELDAALAAGDARAAARALWSWLAWSLHTRGVAAYEEDLTNREFVGRVGGAAPGLGDIARSIDTLVYGPDRPSVGDVRALVPAAEALLR